MMFVRWVVALLFMLNVIPLDLRYKWYLHHGGDQAHFLALATSLLKGQPEPRLVGIGQALVMMPWVAILKPYNYLELVAPLVVINGFILGGLSVLLVGGIAWQMVKQRSVALVAAAIWALLPLIAYFSFFWHFDAVKVRSSTVPAVGWLNGLSDGPAMFFTLLSVWLLARIMDQGKQPPFWDLAGIGASLSLIIMFRVHFALAVALMLVYVVLAHGWRSLAVVVGAGLIMYIPQAWYNQVVFGLPITTGYISAYDVEGWGGTLYRPLSDIIRVLPFNPAQINTLFEYYLGRRPWLLIPLLGLIAVALYILVVLQRKYGWHSVTLLLGVPLAYLGPMAFTWPFRQAILRFSMPIYPFVIIVCVYAGWQIWAGFQRLSKNRA